MVNSLLDLTSGPCADPIPMALVVVRDEADRVRAIADLQRAGGFRVSPKAMMLAAWVVHIETADESERKTAMIGGYNVAIVPSGFDVDIVSWRFRAGVRVAVASPAKAMLAEAFNQTAGEVPASK